MRPACRANSNGWYETLRRKCKLYRFDTGGQEWKERGVGHVRLLKHKESQRIRLLMRQEKTLKIRANHIGTWVYR